ncbi:hypothetical protein ABNQ38_14480 (plasmid) [Azospirillum sp. A29]|uniref:hypothetical protein n=1 Tax=Azospirillum sp. A29 TaxID=3160606 RepID=UPI00366CF37E
MSPSDDPDFGAKERDLIRRKFMQRMSSARSIHDGFLLRRWSTGERKGQPKVPAAVQSMLDRGLVALDDLDKHWPVARSRRRDSVPCGGWPPTAGPSPRSATHVSSRRLPR